jgi:TolB-like protein/Flp pilus assembly protein TadD
VTTPKGAVFLSYASQDAEAAQKICEALRTAGIEVWFDQSDLRGGDAWDHKIRQQIHDCALFIPVISSNTASRHEGYFRLEWDLADQRTHMIARNRAFIVPVCLDATLGAGADVPESFQRVQWTRLPGGETPPEFVRRIVQLLAGVSLSSTVARVPAGVAVGKSSHSKPLWFAVAVVLAAGAAYLFIQKPWIPKSAPPFASTFDPPPHSIAVLPFVNMSGDKEQEYFSDGLTEELLNSLTRIDDLHVAARTSAFSFKGKDADIDTIARKLNVAAVLEGSVRRSTHTVRITAQLVNAVTGFHMWSQTYDRDLGDVLALETEIATSVANALKVTLLEDTGRKIELGGTANPAAFDAYLRGKMKARTWVSDEQGQAVLAAFTEAIDLDPHFAKAFAERSLEQANYARFNARDAAVRATFDKALSDAQMAVTLAPGLAEGHYALGVVLEDGFWEFAQANEEFERALALAPGSARILGAYSRHAAELGHKAAAIAAARRAVALDPLNPAVHHTVGIAFYLARQYADAIDAFQRAISLQSDDVREYALLGQAQYELRDFQAARAQCEVARADIVGQGCLAVVYRKLGREADADFMLQRLRASLGDDGAYDFAVIYAQWGDIPQALHWLEAAVRRRDSGLTELEVEPDLDPLRNEPRFQAIERELRFPQ